MRLSPVRRFTYPRLASASVEVIQPDSGWNPRKMPAWVSVRSFFLDDAGVRERWAAYRRASRWLFLSPDRSMVVKVEMHPKSRPYSHAQSVHEFRMWQKWEKINNGHFGTWRLAPVLEAGRFGAWLYVVQPFIPLESELAHKGIHPYAQRPFEVGVSGLDCQPTYQWRSDGEVEVLVDYGVPEDVAADGFDSPEP